MTSARLSVRTEAAVILWEILKKWYIGLNGSDGNVFVDYTSSISIRVEVRPAAPARSYDGPEFCPQWPAYGGWTKQASTDFRVSLYGH